MTTDKKYSIRSWRRTIRELMEQTGLTFKDVCDYVGITYNENEPAFYAKRPQKRRVVIGIGMAFHQPLEVINEWITHYAGKKRLYAKDITEDLIWIYLIGANTADPDPAKNYFRLYDRCQAVTHATWQELWDEFMTGAKSTADVEAEFEHVTYDEDFEGLKDFVIDHMNSFKTAYMRPRRMLEQYVEQILETCRAFPSMTEVRRVSDLRGWLDDNMINYLSGDSGTVNVIDPKSRRRTRRVKHVPKSKKTHISMCLALGMTAGEINEYLELMGYLPLSEDDTDEKRLITMLDETDIRYPLTVRYKKLHFKHDESVKMTGSEQLQAVEEMMMLRQTLKSMYKMRGYPFPYLRE